MLAGMTVTPYKIKSYRYRRLHPIRRALHTGAAQNRPMGRPTPIRTGWTPTCTELWPHGRPCRSRSRWRFSRCWEPLGRCSALGVPLQCVACIASVAGRSSRKCGLGGENSGSTVPPKCLPDPPCDSGGTPTDYTPAPRGAIQFGGPALVVCAGSPHSGQRIGLARRLYPHRWQFPGGRRRGRSRNAPKAAGMVTHQIDPHVDFMPVS